jgi:hypothetical protein
VNAGFDGEHPRPSSVEGSSGQTAPLAAAGKSLSIELKRLLAELLQMRVDTLRTFPHTPSPFGAFLLPKLRVGNPLVRDIEIAANTLLQGSPTLDQPPAAQTIRVATSRRADAPPINLEGTPIHSGRASIHLRSSYRRTYVNVPQPWRRGRHERRKNCQVRNKQMHPKFLTLKKAWLCLTAVTAAVLFLNETAEVRASAREISVRPHETDAAITLADKPHYVAYDSQAVGGLLFVFMPGTGGTAQRSPLLDTAIEQRYRAISLSYPNTPAVAQVCVGSGDHLCAAKFREKRAFGSNKTSDIADAPADSIVNRLTKLLQYLSVTQANSGWDKYLLDGKPRWNCIVLGGQSQGGGMAAFIAKKRAVARVISFSGGWDNQGQPGPVRPADVAAWYSAPASTPADRWFGTYHEKEENAAAIARTYDAMGIPKGNVVVFRTPVPKGTAHGFGANNPANVAEWRRLLGDGAASECK